MKTKTKITLALSAILLLVAIITYFRLWLLVALPIIVVLMWFGCPDATVLSQSCPPLTNAEIALRVALGVGAGLAVIYGFWRLSKRVKDGAA